MESNVIHYSDLLNEVFLKLFNGSRDEKDIQLFKRLTAWQSKEYG